MTTVDRFFGPVVGHTVPQFTAQEIMPRKDPILLWVTGILIEARASEIKPWLCGYDSWDLELHFFLAVGWPHKLFS